MLRVTRNLYSLSVQGSALHNSTVAGPQIFIRSISSHHKVNSIPSGNLNGCGTKNRHLSSVFLTGKCVRQPLFAVTTSQSASTLILSRFFSVSLHMRQTAESSSLGVPHVVEADSSNPIPNKDDPSSSSNSQLTALEADATTVDPSIVQSTASPPSNELVLDFLPEKPTPLVMDNIDVANVVNWVGDPPLETLGLASWWPTGRMQALMEYLHGSVELPWWATIMCVTLMLRLLTFPLVVKMQRNVAVMNNYNPKLMAIQSKISDARKRGDSHDVAALSMELQDIFKKNKISPFSNMIPMMVQLPIFMSMFFGLKGMANLPLESMMSGGALWFKDLTVADPYYGLPLLMASSLFLQFKFAADGASLENSGPIARNVMKVIPIILFPVTMNFPSAITFYWVTTNCISIAQAVIVRQEVVRKYLNIPKRIKWEKKDLPGSTKTFREGVRDMIDNSKVQADIFDRRLYDAESFKQAGSGKVKRTYKFDPTKSSRI